MNFVYFHKNIVGLIHLHNTTLFVSLCFSNAEKHAIRECKYFLFSMSLSHRNNLPIYLIFWTLHYCFC